MSFTLAMVLAVGMAVPGNGPEMVSVEMEQGLDLRGEWKGTWKQDGNSEAGTVSLHQDGYRLGKWGKFLSGMDLTYITDEGDGKFTLDGVFLGIYRQDGDHLTLCFQSDRTTRPSSFQAGDGQELIILHRVKPRKRPCPNP